MNGTGERPPGRPTPPAGTGEATDDVERPIWRPDWSTPTTARQLAFFALVAAGLIALWRRRRKR